MFKHLLLKKNPQDKEIQQELRENFVTNRWCYNEKTSGEESQRVSQVHWFSGFPELSRLIQLIFALEGMGYVEPLRIIQF